MELLTQTGSIDTLSLPPYSRPLGMMLAVPLSIPLCFLLEYLGGYSKVRSPSPATRPLPAH